MRIENLGIGKTTDMIMQYNYPFIDKTTFLGWELTSELPTFQELIAYARNENSVAVFKVKWK